MDSPPSELGDQHSDLHQRQLAKLRRVASFMDTAYVIPLVGVKIGWDGILGFIPGLGTLTTVLVHCYVFSEAIKLKAGLGLHLRMATNTLVDAVIGLVPVLGDILDVFWRCHSKNVDLLAESVRRRNSRHDHPPKK